MNTSKLFSKAHSRTRKAIAQDSTNDYRVVLSFFLTQLWADKKRKDAKEAQKARELKVTTENTIKETEKAVLVSCLIANNRVEFDANYNKYHTETTELDEVWIPKSQIDQRTGKVSRFIRKEANYFDNLYNV